MPAQVAAASYFPIPSDHLEQLSRGVSALTVDPYKNAINYFFPFIGAFFAGYNELRNDPAQEAMMPVGPTTRILKEVEALTDCAGIERKVIPYVALNHSFSSCGGGFSLTTPALFIPDQHLFRRDGKSPFGQEQPQERLRENRWIFSDDETRFLICRELGQIKENSALLRIAIKVSVLMALFVIYASPFGWPLGLALFVGVLGLYIISERCFQGRADIVAAEILGKKLNNPQRAAQIGIDVIEKIRQQNLYRREQSGFACLYITETGTNLLDFAHPSPSTRAEKLRPLA